jgi:hypothetical protein
LLHRSPASAQHFAGLTSRSRRSQPREVTAASPGRGYRNSAGESVRSPAQPPTTSRRSFG